MNMAHVDDFRDPFRAAVSDLLQRYGCDVPGLADLCAGAALRAADKVMEGACLIRLEGVGPDDAKRLANFLEAWRGADASEVGVSIFQSLPPSRGLFSRRKISEMGTRFLERSEQMRHSGFGVSADDYLHLSELCAHLASLAGSS